MLLAMMLYKNKPAAVEDLDQVQTEEIKQDVGYHSL